MTETPAQVVKGGGDVTLEGGLVVEGTLVVEAGTRLHTDGSVVLTPTAVLEIVIRDREALETGIFDIIVCTPLDLCFLLSISACGVCVPLFVMGVVLDFWLVHTFHEIEFELK
jgi:hypothetical protein